MVRINYDNGYYEGSTRDRLFFNGDYKRETRYGYGKMTYYSGDVYSGEFVDDKMHGRGKYISSNGDVYEGEWRNGQKYGKGRHRYSNGYVYEGEWVDDKRQGKGKLTYTNGDVYDGEWKDDKKHGAGITRYADGSATKEVWERGYCISSTPLNISLSDKTSESQISEASEEKINEESSVRIMLDAMAKMLPDNLDAFEVSDDFDSLICEFLAELIKSDEGATRITTIKSAEKLIEGLDRIKMAVKRAEIQLTKLNDDDYCNLKKMISDGSEGK